ncbi:MAG: 3'(2'),5'-bisphosphate nucleotidase CysQ [Thermaurantimonas sp.]
MKELDIFLQKAIRAASEAALRILTIYESSDFEVFNKEDETPVTFADYESDRIIHSHLKPTGIPVVSEESTYSHLTDKNLDTYWLVDPLDGTKEFIKQNGEFCINIALIKEHRPALGIIAIPVTHKIYCTAKGAGVSKSQVNRWGLNENFKFEPLTKPTLPGEHEQLVFLKSKSHSSSSDHHFIQDHLNRKYSLKYRQIGSAIKFTEIIEGQGHVYHRMGPTMAWDTAAGHAMLLEFGGTILDLETGQELAYNLNNLKNNEFVASLMSLKTIL